MTGWERILARRGDQQFYIPVSKRSCPPHQGFDDMISQYVSEQHCDQHAGPCFPVLFCDQKDDGDQDPDGARIAQMCDPGEEGVQERSS